VHSAPDTQNIKKGGYMVHTLRFNFGIIETL